MFTEIEYAVIFLTITNYFSFLSGASEYTFETTLTYTLVVAWNYHVDYQMTKTGSRTTKMELFVTILSSFHSLTIVKKISILDVAGILFLTHSLRRAES